MSDTTPADTADVAPVESAPTETTPPAPSPADIPAKTPAAPEAATEAPKSADEPQEHPELAKLRREAAKYRTERNDTRSALEAREAALAEREAEAGQLRDMLTKLQQVLNPDAPTEEAPDPAKLAEALAAAEAERERIASEKDAKIRELTVKAALPGVFDKLKADPNLTLAVLTADGVMGRLDPTSDDFTADLELAVAAALDSNPKLKVAPAVTRSGAEVPGGSPASNQLTREQAAELGKTNPAALVEAMKAGRLKNLGVS